MVDVEFLSMFIVVVNGDYELCIWGCIIKFDGFFKVVLQFVKKDEDVVLLDIQVDEVLDLKKLDLSQYFIKFVFCYIEVSLVKELEKQGIGWFLIYVLIILIIQDWGYVCFQN